MHERERGRQGNVPLWAGKRLRTLGRACLLLAEEKGGEVGDRSVMSGECGVGTGVLSTPQRSPSLTSQPVPPSTQTAVISSDTRPAVRLATASVPSQTMFSVEE